MKALVAHASKAGSTEEIAGAVAEVLITDGVEVDILEANKVKDVEPYNLVALGTAVRMGKVLSPAVKFVEKHREKLTQIPTVYFVVCMTMKDDTEESRQEVAGYIEPLVSIVKPKNVGLFAGKLVPEELGPALRTFFAMDREGKFPTGDYRDWELIRDWASVISELLQE